jgi:outer membrane protein assembly factor BamA
MFAGLYAKLIGLAVVLALIAGGALLIHHKGAESQKAVDAKVIAALHVQIDGYQAAAEQTATVLLRVNKAAEDAKADAATQKLYADAALQQLRVDRKAASEAESQHAATVAVAEKTPACDTTLTSKLCPDIANGY